MGDTRQDELFQKVKDRFIASCREVLLNRLKDVQDQYPNVDPDLIVELVILTGIGYLNRMTKQKGTEHVSKYFEDLLQEFTKVVCLHDDGLLAAIKSVLEMYFTENAANVTEDTTTTVKVQTSIPLPGIGLFGSRFFFNRREN